MQPILEFWLPLLLGFAVLLPLISFFLILPAGRWLGKWAGYLATFAIISSCALSFIAFGLWLVPTEDGNFPPDVANAHHESHGDESHDENHDADDKKGPKHDGEKAGHAHPHGDGDDRHGPKTAGHDEQKVAYAGIYGLGPYKWILGRFGESQLAITYYIDALTMVMFCMVTLIASCIHFYAMGYMHDELHDVTDHEVTLENGEHLKRPGRYPRFFQALSLFCFSMLGLVLAGNIAMVFCFWELVGICSYFLIGFYVERKSASTAANKAFIVNRVGDFGMIIGLMIFWTGVGTLSFGEYTYADLDGEHHVASLFGELRTEANDHQLVSTYHDDDDNLVATPNTPDGLVRLAAQSEIAKLRLELMAAGESKEEIEKQIEARIPFWRDPVKYRYDLAHHSHDESEAGHDHEHAEVIPELAQSKTETKYGYWLLIVGGLGIFCGCVGKSAQFPLHVWLPDAMEGPTPVSALVHSATMVAAGVYLVGRFFPAFVPEVLLAIAIVGVITLFIGATIAIVATDIKRVLAYSTISQLGYMMLALGLGGWVAGLMHLVTHAFFKSLLFMCSGSVIHSVHTNEMPEMGGLLKKMPITAITMLIGCLAIIGASVPFVIGLSGYYSKDAILEQAFYFMQSNSQSWTALFFLIAAGGAAITAFYMFRLWFMTFLGKPRDQHKYDHAHESPLTMTVPLMITAFFAITVAWSPFGFLPFSGLSLSNLLEQARPEGALVDYYGVWAGIVVPDEHGSHAFWPIKFPVTLLASATAIFGVAIAAAFYWFRVVDPAETKKQFNAVHGFLTNKWWFDELYDFVFVRPAHVVGRLVSNFDRSWIDRLIDSTAAGAKWFANTWTAIADGGVVDGAVNLIAKWTWSIGVWFRNVQTGSVRQYVVFIVIAAIVLFMVIGFFWNPTFAR